MFCSKQFGVVKEIIPATPFCDVFTSSDTTKLIPVVRVRCTFPVHSLVTACVRTGEPVPDTSDLTNEIPRFQFVSAEAFIWLHGLRVEPYCASLTNLHVEIDLQFGLTLVNETEHSSAIASRIHADFLRLDVLSFMRDSASILAPSCHILLRGTVYPSCIPCSRMNTTSSAPGRSSMISTRPRLDRVLTV
jgi:hypothetical protein